MATAIRIPDFGTNVEQVTLVKWIKDVNEPVKRGDILCAVETDKAVMDLESIADGVLLAQVVKEGTEIEQGTVIAYIGTPGEPVGGESVPAAGNPARKPATQPAAKKSDAGISPLLRNLAKMHGVDPTLIAGTGPEGRITREDILRAAQERGPKPDAGSFSSHHADNQAAVARNVVRSHREIPPIDLVCRVGMTAVLAARRKTAEEKHVKISFDAWFIAAAAKAMKEFPLFRSRYEAEKTTVTETINVGIAIGSDEELFLPVIKAADTKTVGTINAEIRSFTKKAEQRGFVPGDFAGATLTVSNLGMYPVSSFRMVIPPGQTAGLAVGAIEETPVARDGAVTVVPTVQITLSVDHRLINGREAARFLAHLKETLECL